MTSRKPTTTPTTKLIERAALVIGLAYTVTTVHHIYGGLVDSAPNRLRVPIINGDLEVAVAGEPHRCGHVGGVAAEGDQSRAPIDDAVPDSACVVVSIAVAAQCPGTPGSASWLVLSWFLLGRWVHRNIGGHRDEVSYLDFEVRNLDFPAVERRGRLRS